MTNLPLKFWLVAHIAKAEKDLAVDPNKMVTVDLAGQKQIYELALTGLERLEMER